MPKTSEELDIWDRLICYTQGKPLNFNAFSKDYDIKKLELHKITPLELRSKRKQLQQRHWQQGEEQSKSWLENQYRLFIWFTLAYTKMFNKQPQKFTEYDWSLIANCFKKYPYVCQYFCLSCKKIRPQTWTDEQDTFIQKMMESNMYKKWTSIGLQLYRVTEGRRLRKPKAIRQRWLSHLNPEINRSDWTLQQQLELVQKIRTCGKKWSKIAKDLGNRSEHTVKNRFHKIMLKFKKRKDQRIQLYSQQKILELIQLQLRRKQNQRNPKKFIKIQNQENNETSTVKNTNNFKPSQSDPTIDFGFRTTILAPVYILIGAFNCI